MNKEVLPFSNKTCHMQDLLSTMIPIMDMFTPFLESTSQDIHQLGFPKEQTIFLTQPQEILIFFNGTTHISPN